MQKLGLGAGLVGGILTRLNFPLVCARVECVVNRVRLGPTGLQMRQDRTDPGNCNH